MTEPKAWRVCWREGCESAAPCDGPCPMCGSPDRPDLITITSEHGAIATLVRPLPAWCRVCGGPCDDRGECPRQSKHGSQGTDARTREDGRGGAASMALRVSCPKCQAKMGRPCVTKHSTPTEPHRKRREKSADVILGRAA